MSWVVRNPSDPHPELIHIRFGDSSYSEHALSKDQNFFVILIRSHHRDRSLHCHQAIASQQPTAHLIQCLSFKMLVSSQGEKSASPNCRYGKRTILQFSLAIVEKLAL